MTAAATPPSARPITLDVPGSGTVSALWLAPPGARAVYAFAHGAGAGMDHPFMAALAHALALRSVATLRYQFPFMERGSRRVDAPAVAQAAVRAATACACGLMPGVRLFAGGKSFGGRMTSQAQAAAPLPGVAGLAFVGFPLHPAGKPGTVRAGHLADVGCPMLFLQGTNDALADLGLLRGVLALLHQATLRVFEGADHGFRVKGSSEAQMVGALADAMAAWFAAVGAAV